VSDIFVIITLVVENAVDKVVITVLASALYAFLVVTSLFIVIFVIVLAILAVIVFVILVVIVFAILVIVFFIFFIIITVVVVSDPATSYSPAELIPLHSRICSDVCERSNCNSEARDATEIADESGVVLRSRASGELGLVAQDSAQVENMPEDVKRRDEAVHRVQSGRGERIFIKHAAETVSGVGIARTQALRDRF
jgi:hypothetical protein